MNVSKIEKQTGGTPVLQFYAFAFGLFLGLCIWKFGNPVILDQKILPPNSSSEFWNDSWPTHWANWILLPLAIIGGILTFKNRHRKRSEKSAIESRQSKINWLWLLPLLWFGWEIVSATQTVDAELTATTLWQFFGCVICYFLGTFLFSNFSARNYLLIGILAAFAFCLVRAVNQKLVEFPRSQQMLIEGQRENWTNLSPEMVLELKREQIIVHTNGVDVANPAVLAKFSKGRVIGTVVYPNALAGIILLLLPVSLALAFSIKLRPAIQAVIIPLAVFLGFGGLFWSGSKAGWLIAMGIGGLYLLRWRWQVKSKMVAMIIIAVVGLGIFAVRFHNYFAKGATSVTARFDYWRAAIQTTAAHPILGTGPGTFQRPYAEIKAPDAEMARLAHNDYLEQFSDSGIPGGIFYTSWIFLALTIVGWLIWSARTCPCFSSTRHVASKKSGVKPSQSKSRDADAISFAIFVGVLGWFVQGFVEFSLFIPALAWTAFTLLGSLIGNQFDKNRQNANLAAK